MKEFNFSKIGKADLHIHSRYSNDSFSSIKKILKRAKKKGLNVIAITDHNTIEGAIEAKKIASDFGLEVIIGEEITTKEGDVIALFIKKSILSGKNILETIKEIKEQGGLVIIPHPDTWFLKSVSHETLFKIFNEIDGIELLNSAWTTKNKKEENKVLNKLFFNLAEVSGSDAHLANHVGCAYTVFPGQKSEDLYRAIKERKTISSGSPLRYKDKIFWLINAPRFFWRSPETFKNGVKQVIKNGIKRIIKKK